MPLLCQLGILGISSRLWFVSASVGVTKGSSMVTSIQRDDGTPETASRQRPQPACAPEPSRAG